MKYIYRVSHQRHTVCEKRSSMFIYQTPEFLVFKTPVSVDYSVIGDKSYYTCVSVDTTHVPFVQNILLFINSEKNTIHLLPPISPLYFLLIRSFSYTGWDLARNLTQ